MKFKAVFSRRKASDKPPPQIQPVPKANAAPCLRAKVHAPQNATLFHVTHAKAASQWMRAIFEDLFGQATVAPEYHGRQVWGRPIECGRVYTCFAVGKPEFDSLEMPADARPLVLIRDLRDTLVSAYFSLRNTHELKTDELSYHRALLQRLDREQGLLYLMETWLTRAAWIQRTWLQSDVPCIKVEDCFEDPAPVLRRLFRDHWHIDLNSALLEQVATRHSFAKLSGGRAPGQQDNHSHYRKGMPGDWLNYFTPRLAARFEYLYNDVLLLGGYASDAGWSADVCATAELAA